MIAIEHPKQSLFQVFSISHFFVNWLQVSPLDEYGEQFVTTHRTEDSAHRIAHVHESRISHHV